MVCRLTNAIGHDPVSGKRAAVDKEEADDDDNVAQGDIGGDKVRGATVNFEAFGHVVVEDEQTGFAGPDTGDLAELEHDGPFGAGNGKFDLAGSEGGDNVGGRVTVAPLDLKPDGEAADDVEDQSKGHDVVIGLEFLEAHNHLGEGIGRLDALKVAIETGPFGDAEMLCERLRQEDMEKRY